MRIYNTNKTLKSALLGSMALVATWLFSVAAAQSLMLDDFLSDNFVILDTAPQATENASMSNSGTIGGTRDVRITNNYPVSAPGFRGIFSDTPFSSGKSSRDIGTTLNLPTGGGTNGDVDWVFTYNANGAGLGANLTKYPTIELLWEGDHHGFLNGSFVSLMLEDSLGNTHTETFSWNAGIPNQVFVETTVWDLSLYSNAGVNISDVDAIVFAGNTDGSADYAFSGLTAVPEPSAVFVAMLSVVFLARRRLRS